MTMRVLWIAPAIGLVIAGCPAMPKPDGCSPGAQRCYNDVPQVCSPSGRWSSTSRPCIQVGAQCCNTPSVYDGRPIYTCATPARCLDADGGAQ